MLCDALRADTVEELDVSMSIPTFSLIPVNNPPTRLVASAWPAPRIADVDGDAYSASRLWRYATRCVYFLGGLIVLIFQLLRHGMPSSGLLKLHISPLVQTSPPKACYNLANQKCSRTKSSPTMDTLSAAHAARVSVVVVGYTPTARKAVRCLSPTVNLRGRKVTFWRKHSTCKLPCFILYADVRLVSFMAKLTRACYRYLTPASLGRSDYRV